MRPLETNALRCTRATLICSALLVFLVLPHAQAKTSRHRKQTAGTVTLQPFSLVESEVRAAAAPVVDQAPRILRAVAARADRAGDNEQEDEEDYSPQSIRVASQSARRLPAEPEPKSDDDYDQEQDQDQDQEQEQENEEELDPQIERRGDRPTVAGNRAVLRNGIAYAPSRAPQAVKNAIWAANTLRRKPYIWGGGHGSFRDYGYDCSGAVSFALHGAGVLGSPLPSTDLMRYGKRGRGRWITIYSRPGHTFAVIAGLRFDTTDFRGGNDDVGPRWYTDGRNLRGFRARHPAGL